MITYYTKHIINVPVGSCSMVLAFGDNEPGPVVTDDRDYLKSIVRHTIVRYRCLIRRAFCTRLLCVSGRVRGHRQ